MTYQSKEDLFRLYLEGKIDFVKKDQGEALDDLFKADFGTQAYFDAAERYERAGAKWSSLNQILRQFNTIFRREE